MKAAGFGGYGGSIVVDDDMVHKLPPETKLDYAAILEPLSIVWHAIKIFGVNDWTKASVLVLGGGPIGLGLVLCLKAVGAASIIISEPTQARRQLQAEFVTAAVNPDTEDVTARCLELSGGEGVDVVFDCAGVQAALDTRFKALKYEGLFIEVAVWKAPMVVPSFELLAKHITLKGTLTTGDGEVAEVIKLIAEGRLEGYEKKVTARILLADIGKEGFEELVNHKDDHIKILVTPRSQITK